MELSPRSPRRIEESTGSSSSELQPSINLDGRSILHVQDEFPALEQQQQQLLHDCEKEHIHLQNEIRVLRQLVYNSGMRLHQLEEGTSMNITQLRTCLEEKENENMENTILEVVAQDMTEHLEPFETVERLQKAKLEKLFEQLRTLETENENISIKLHRADQEAEALGKEIENLQVQLLEESDRLLANEKRNTSPESESNHPPSASDKGI